MRTILLAALSLVATGCSAYCDFHSGSTRTEDRCQERLNTFAAAAFKATCSAAQGTAGDGACPTDGRIGGCFLGAQGDGSKVNDWYYAPKTVEDAKNQCAGDNGTWLDP
jgi:hypothetical protein